jgi:phosphohistidine phosphatase
MKKAAQGMRSLKIVFDAVVSSPYTRARQTADIAAAGTEYSGQVLFSDALVPQAHFSDFSNLILEFKPGDKVLFVGHMPSLGNFISALTSGDEGAFVEMKKGSLCRLTVEKQSASLDWLMTSKQLRLLA